MKEKGKIVIGVVEGDIHDIGKNIVKVMLEASGYQIIDLGKDVPTEKFIETVGQENPSILAMSALMTTTMMKMIRKKITKTAPGSLLPPPDPLLLRLELELLEPPPLLPPPPPPPPLLCTAMWLAKKVLGRSV